MSDKIIYYSFGLLFFLVPLFWSPLNFELFEFNKMILVYGLTVIIVGAWLLKTINDQRLTINRTPLDIPLLLFLASQILSTIFSIDQHTSLWGYYSRSNGGLLSLVSYLLLYWAFVSNIQKDQVFKILKIGLVSGFIVSLWGILEHFGVSPSCVILRQELTASCWVQDVQTRVFATLGQPNWMASYLGMLIFPSLYFFLTAKKRLEFGIWYLVLIAYYLAFTFTYSRGPTLGLVGGMVVFLFFHLRSHIGSGKLRSGKLNFKHPLTLTLISFLLINILFGSALTSFRLVSKFAPPPRPSISLPTTPSSGTQLEAGGTESGQIRLIVWEGAFDIFKHYPILGSGVETFAYSYYQFRPLGHNLVSEWDFLYNKAHNEFLNYLANTGLVGFGAYCIIFITFIIFILKEARYKNLLLLSLLASYISYLAGNFFGFSVVITALLFFLFPGVVFVATDSVSTLHFPSSKFNFLLSIVYRHSKIGSFIVLLPIIYLLLSIFNIWHADILFAKGQHEAQTGSPGKAYNYLTEALSLRPNEPFYLSELGVAAASSALTLKDIDATFSAALKKQSQEAEEYVLKSSPKNISFWKSAIRAYYDLSLLDSSYNDKLLQTFDSTIKLAPTDPKLLYNKAVVLSSLDRNDEAIENLNKALSLKPNYREAYLAKGLILFDRKIYPEAVAAVKEILRLIPGDPEALQILNDWGKQGIATDSGISN